LNNNLQFYRDRAEQARREGREATLAHVRERCRRSEQAWTVLADRLADTAANRAARDKERAAMPPQSHEEQFATDDNDRPRPSFPPPGESPPPAEAE